MPSPNFGIDKAYLIGTWLESSFWGALTIIFILSITTSRYRSSGRISIVVICLLYLLATAHAFLSLARTIQGFIVETAKPEGAVLYFADNSQALNRSTGSIYTTMIILSDLYLVWRCFVVWNRNYVVIALPLLLVAVCAASGYAAVAEVLHDHPVRAIAGRFIVIAMPMSLAVNILVTPLTAGRIWMLSRKLDTRAYSPTHVRFHFIVHIILESGTALSLIKIIEFTLYMLSPNDETTGLNAVYIVTNCTPQVMAICPTLISLAVSMGLTVHSSSTAADSSFLQFAHSTQIRSAPLTLNNQ